jgi:glutamate--cysteine ligase
LLEQQLLNKEKEIETWFEAEWQSTPAPVYGSVDLRNAGFKIAPVDMNLFPAGFNNLNPEFLPISVEAARLAITQLSPKAQHILLVPENHTRNFFYWQSIAALLRILTAAGFSVHLGSLLPSSAEVKMADHQKILLHPITRKGNLVKVQDFVPDIILLNNDLSAGIPDILQHISQPIFPPVELGWSQRLKSGHFQCYAAVSQSFAAFINMDPWLIAPLFQHCGEIDFMQGEGQACLAGHVEQLLVSIQKKYTEYEISCKPFVIVKADAGTYGMAVMTVRDADEIRSLNRKQRTQMAKSKGGKPVHQVIVQEGIYTFERYGPHHAVAEPVLYLWGKQVTGGFYRVHKDRDIDENLNAPGMHFEPLAFTKSCARPVRSEECQNHFYAYNVIARLSMLAAAREIKYAL